MNSDPEANLPFLFAVFIITWALFFAYAIYMSIKQRRMEKEIDTPRASLSVSYEVPDMSREKTANDGLGMALEAHEPQKQNLDDKEKLNDTT